MGDRLGEGFGSLERGARGAVGVLAYQLRALALRFLLHTSFLSPLFVLWLWTKPMARDFLHQAPLGRTSFSL